ncbi:MAG: type II toxin-antitoxin system PemK/MazF family toxin [Chloroflexota bacterium]|nr:type II toxin-antitoxin system PemK/MazF family toxin [Chloroflexota bacterium]
MINPHPQRGEVWRVNLPEPFGSEPGGVRYAVVVQNGVLHGLRTRLVVICYSSINPMRYKGNVFLPKGTGGLPQDCEARCHQLYPADVRRFIERVGEAPPHTLAEVEVNLLFCLGISSVRETNT